MKPSDIVRRFVSIYNRTITEQNVKDYIYNPETNVKDLLELVDDVITANVITRDKEKAFCLFHLVTALRNRNQIPIYRWPADGSRKKILNLSDWCDDLCKTFYKNLSNEVRNLI